VGNHGILEFQHHPLLCAHTRRRRRAVQARALVFLAGLLLAAWLYHCLP
jgi:hypothetical protein